MITSSYVNNHSLLSAAILVAVLVSVGLDTTEAIGHSKRPFPAPPPYGYGGGGSAAVTGPASHVSPSQYPASGGPTVHSNGPTSVHYNPAYHPAAGHHMPGAVSSLVNKLRGGGGDGFRHPSVMIPAAGIGQRASGFGSKIKSGLRGISSRLRHPRQRKTTTTTMTIIAGPVAYATGGAVPVVQYSNHYHHPQPPQPPPPAAPQGQDHYGPGYYHPQPSPQSHPVPSRSGHTVAMVPSSVPVPALHIDHEENEHDEDDEDYDDDDDEVDATIPDHTAPVGDVAHGPRVPGVPALPAPPYGSGQPPAMGKPKPSNSGRPEPSGTKGASTKETPVALERDETKHPVHEQQQQQQQQQQPTPEATKPPKDINPPAEAAPLGPAAGSGSLEPSPETPATEEIRPISSIPESTTQPTNTDVHEPRVDSVAPPSAIEPTSAAPAPAPAPMVAEQTPAATVEEPATEGPPPHPRVADTTGPTPGVPAAVGSHDHELAPGDVVAAEQHIPGPTGPSEQPSIPAVEPQTGPTPPEPHHVPEAPPTVEASPTGGPASTPEAAQPAPIDHAMEEPPVEPATPGGLEPGGTGGPAQDPSLTIDVQHEPKEHPNSETPPTGEPAATADHGIVPAIEEHPEPTAPTEAPAATAADHVADSPAAEHLVPEMETTPPDDIHPEMTPESATPVTEAPLGVVEIPVVEQPESTTSANIEPHHGPEVDPTGAPLVEPAAAVPDLTPAPEHPVPVATEPPEDIHPTAIVEPETSGSHEPVTEAAAPANDLPEPTTNTNIDDVHPTAAPLVEPTAAVPGLTPDSSPALAGEEHEPGTPAAPAIVADMTGATTEIPAAIEPHDHEPERPAPGATGLPEHPVDPTTESQTDHPSPHEPQVHPIAGTSPTGEPAAAADHDPAPVAPVQATEEHLEPTATSTEAPGAAAADHVADRPAAEHLVPRITPPDDIHPEMTPEPATPVTEAPLGAVEIPVVDQPESTTSANIEPHHEPGVDPTGAPLVEPTAAVPDLTPDTSPAQDMEELDAAAADVTDATTGAPDTGLGHDHEPEQPASGATGLPEHPVAPIKEPQTDHPSPHESQVHPIAGTSPTGEPAATADHGIVPAASAHAIEEHPESTAPTEAAADHVADQPGLGHDHDHDHEPEPSPGAASEAAEHPAAPAEERQQTSPTDEPAASADHDLVPVTPVQAIEEHPESTAPTEAPGATAADHVVDHPAPEQQVGTHEEQASEVDTPADGIHPVATIVEPGTSGSSEPVTEGPASAIEIPVALHPESTTSIVDAHEPELDPAAGEPAVPGDHEPDNTHPSEVAAEEHDASAQTAPVAAEMAEPTRDIPAAIGHDHDHDHELSPAPIEEVAHEPQPDPDTAGSPPSEPPPVEEPATQPETNHPSPHEPVVHPVVEAPPNDEPAVVDQAPDSADSVPAIEEHPGGAAITEAPEAAIDRVPDHPAAEQLVEHHEAPDAPAPPEDIHAAATVEPETVTEAPAIDMPIEDHSEPPTQRPDTNSDFHEPEMDSNAAPPVEPTAAVDLTPATSSTQAEEEHDVGIPSTPPPVEADMEEAPASIEHDHEPEHPASVEPHEAHEQHQAPEPTGPPREPAAPRVEPEIDPSEWPHRPEVHPTVEASPTDEPAIADPAQPADDDNISTPEVEEPAGTEPPATIDHEDVYEHPAWVEDVADEPHQLDHSAAPDIDAMDPVTASIEHEPGTGEDLGPTTSEAPEHETSGHPEHQGESDTEDDLEPEFSLTDDHHEDDDHLEDVAVTTETPSSGQASVEDQARDILDGFKDFPMDDGDNAFKIEPMHPSLDPINDHVFKIPPAEQKPKRVEVSDDLVPPSRQKYLTSVPKRPTKKALNSANIPLQSVASTMSNKLNPVKERRFSRGNKMNTNRNRVTKLNHRMSVGKDDWSARSDLMKNKNLRKANQRVRGSSKSIRNQSKRGARKH